MKDKKYRMIYLADGELKAKIDEMKKEHHLNISAVIRDSLEKKYQELNENKPIN
jgi:uncharacterized protein YlbG (UPF0298 family)